MKKTIALAVITLVFFSTWLNSVPIHATSNKAPNYFRKHLIGSSSTIWVPDNYTTIQVAVDNANEGDTIFVRAGTYYEHVNIDKALSLVGENNRNTIIDGNYSGTSVQVTTNNVTLKNFAIRNSEIGIWLWSSHNVTLTDNIAANNSFGFFLSYSSDNVVSRNNVSHGSRYGIYFSYCSNNALTDNNIFSNNENGIHLWRSDYNVFDGNFVFDNDNGIYLSKADHNTFAGNVISNNGDGSSLDECRYNTFTDNTFSSNKGNGLVLYHSSANIVSDNRFLNNSHGIYVGDSDNNILLDNDASNNNHGIRLDYSVNNILVGNTLTNNSYGIFLDSSNLNKIFHNDLIDNTHHVYDDSWNFPFALPSTNIWDEGYPSGGNYWSDYDDADADWDGIGDTPYVIDENNQDNYPLMAEFLQLSVLVEAKVCVVDIVCNSRISDFQLHSDLNDGTNAVSFKVNGADFCRISIPKSLIEPPFAVRVDGSPPSYSKKVYANGTHTWLYFAYDPTEHEIMILHTSSSQQITVYQLTILGLMVISVVLFSISVNYYRLFNKKKRAMEAYEREVGSFPVSHEERARMRFIKDVIEREEKLEKFKKKYGIKIQPANTLEDLMEKLGVKKES